MRTLLSALYLAAAPLRGASPEPIPPAAISIELTAARSLDNHANYDAAGKLYAQILTFDPANKSAQAGRELIKQAFTQTSRDRPQPKRDAIIATYPAVPTKYDATIESWGTKDRNVACALKLSKIILPEVALDGLRAADALEFLQCESVRLDTDPNPLARGVKISLEPAQGGAIISLHLHNALLNEALDFLARELNLRVAINAGQVTLVPARSFASPGLLSDRFRAWPELTAALNGQVNPAYSPNGQYVITSVVRLPLAEANSFLEARGIVFPPGAKAVYIPPGKVIMSNTAENLDKMAALVERFDGVGAPPAGNEP